MENLGKRERLRQGQTVELKPGVFGRLNKENRTLELDSGKVLPISQEDQRSLFPSDEGALDVARRTEKLEKQIKSSPFGEFAYKFGTQSFLGAPKDIVDYFTQTGDEYLRQKEAEGRVSSRISEESPITSGLATAASIVPDMFLTQGMSAVKAAPLLTTLQAGSRVFSEPGEVAKEALFSAAGGKIIDMGANALTKIANRRQLSREMPGKQAAVRDLNVKGEQAIRDLNLQASQNVKNLNLAGEQAVKDANLIQNQSYNALRANVKRINQNRLADYEKELLKRNNLMIYAENKQKAAKFASDFEKKRLDDEFRLATKQYQEALKKLPELQKKAQKEFSEEVLRNVQKIEKSFPENSKISSLEMDVEGFFNNVIDRSGSFNPKSSAQSKRILKSLFSEGESFSAKELASKYKAIEDAIAVSNPEVKSVLNKFKDHLGERIPKMVSNNIAYKRIIPSIKKQMEKNIEAVLKKTASPQGYASNDIIKKRMKENLDLYFNEISPQNLVEKMKNGELREEILNRIIQPYDVAPFEPMILANGRKGVVVNGVSVEPSDFYTRFHDTIKNDIRGKIDDVIAKSEIQTIIADADASKRLGASIKKTYGFAEPIPEPQAPTNPNLGPQPFNPDLGPIQTPPLPPKPQMLADPIAPTPQTYNPIPAPTPQTYNPIPEPTLAPASGMSERIGDFLEKDLLGGKTLVNNPLSKLAGLKYVLGKAALPAEAAYLGLKGLTSPTAAGEAARLTFKQAGIKAVDTWAQKYSSYRNGVLEDPQERRSLTKEIEDDPNIPIEQKAILQSKINRGKPIETAL